MKCKAASVSIYYSFNQNEFDPLIKSISKSYALADILLPSLCFVNVARLLPDC
jgi:hypothetical protein